MHGLLLRHRAPSAHPSHRILPATNDRRLDLICLPRLFQPRPACMPPGHVTHTQSFSYWAAPFRACTTFSRLITEPDSCCLSTPVILPSTYILSARCALPSQRPGCVRRCLLVFCTRCPSRQPLNSQHCTISPLPNPCPRCLAFVIAGRTLFACTFIFGERVARAPALRALTLIHPACTCRARSHKAQGCRA